MTPQEFRSARYKLGLTQGEMAKALGMSKDQVKRMERDSSASSSRPVMPQTEQLVKALLSGYRPENWPQGDDAGRRGPRMAIPPQS